MVRPAAYQHVLCSLLVAGLLVSCTAGTPYESSHEEPAYDHAPRKAMIVKDVVTGKSATLRVTVTLDKGEKSCPSRPEDMEDMRRFVADTMDTLLRRFHVDAKLKTGILGCEANLEDGCVKVKMTFVVKVHPAKKGSDNFPQFLHKLTASSYSHSPICDIHEVACATHKVACMEAEPIFKMPHGTKMVKYSPGNVEDSDEDSGEYGFEGYNFWGFKTKSGKKGKKSDKHGDASADYGAGSEDASYGSGPDYGSDAYGSSGKGAYGASVKIAASAAAAPQKADAFFRVDTRLWPEEKLPTASSGAAEVAAETAAAAAAAAAEEAVSATAAVAATTADPGVDMRLWPDDVSTPWAERAAPLE